MAKFEVTLNQKQAGILYFTRYNITASDGSALQTAFDTLLSLQSQIQTVDVEYLNAFGRNIDVVPALYQPLSLAVTQGVNTGATAPVDMFLSFTFYTNNGRRSTHRIRGFVVNDLTNDSIFNLNFGGDTDQPDGIAGTTTATGGLLYGGALNAYAAGVAAATQDKYFSTIIGYSTRVSVGHKTVRRTY